MKPSRCEQWSTGWLSPGLVKLLLLIVAILVGQTARAALSVQKTTIKALVFGVV